MDPRNEHEYRDFVVAALTEMKTKMDLLITNGGSKGLIPDLRRDVNTHDRQINRWKGALGVIIFLLLFLGAAETWHIAHTAIAAVK